MQTHRKADLILSGNAVFTGLTDTPHPAAIAIVENKIAAIGSKRDMEPFIGEQTKVYEFGEELIMPGFHDFHLHIMFGALSIGSVNLFEARSAQEVAEMVETFATNHPDEEWIIGMQWDAGYWENDEKPHYKILDSRISDRPVILFHAEGHYTWVNRKALELAGITEEIQDPEFGRFERDEKGALTGLLYELAQQPVLEKALQLSQTKKESILRTFLQLTAQYGVTSVNELYAPLDNFIQDFELYKKFEDEGKLTTRIHITPELDGDLEKAQSLRLQYQSKSLQFSGLKQFIDGTVTGHTAYFLSPYTDEPDHGGHAAIERNVFIDRVVQADKLGFRVRIHAIGDAGVRLTLDAFEEAARQNGKRDSRHTVEHIEVIHPSDINRFAALGVSVSMQPDHMAASSRDVYTSIIGPDREKNVFLTKSLLDSGAHLALGTDFPIAISMNPMRQLYTAITRVDNSGNPESTWLPEQKITLAEALRAYTIGSAYGSFREDELGTIEEGKLADVIVLDRNLFTVPPEEWLEVKVKLTMGDGKIIFEDETYKY
ncbi:amidohydrolase [Ammoniphilus sp. YIM 78166]|uniref:amidohydrolase n=1 Tax=Ammoniphilus sp. YIM 78166 TaxID=1644106 RepID=UPI00106F47AB|nr:amidohydrolase [Ammoniphilus sp. YIM 78166]